MGRSGLSLIYFGTFRTFHALKDTTSVTSKSHQMSVKVVQK